MTDLAPHSDFKLRYSLSLGLALALHLVIFLGVAAPGLIQDRFFKPQRKPIQFVNVGIQDTQRPRHIVDPDILNAKKVDYKKEQVAKQGLENFQGKKLSFNDLKVSEDRQPHTRPGDMPQTRTALKGISFENNELKKMAYESFGGAHNKLSGDKISLKYEVPNGKSLDDLNEAELRLYGFLKRGAKNYTTSIMAELHDFELKYPHLNFPLTDTKQVMTGRLTYDEKGNLKQIKMIRWTNVDKLQGFFENVLKRMEIMQNPPKELWAENGEFTVFITLQING